MNYWSSVSFNYTTLQTSLLCPSVSSLLHSPHKMSLLLRMSRSLASSRVGLARCFSFYIFSLVVWYFCCWFVSFICFSPISGNYLELTEKSHQCAVDLKQWGCFLQTPLSSTLWAHNHMHKIQWISKRVELAVLHLYITYLTLVREREKSRN